MDATAHAVLSDLREHGLAQVAGIDRQQYEMLAEQLGHIAERERIALRPGAHAYVAKPGRVPFHTDHPDIDILGWWCEEQDRSDGASLLLDARPVIEDLPPQTRETLRSVSLQCPPLAGGPPTEHRPVLWSEAGREAVFCSPWLRSAWPLPDHERSLEEFRTRLSASAKTAVTSIRLEPGMALLVDNHRVLHGRGPIEPDSRRVLHRLWIQTSNNATHPYR